MAENIVPIFQWVVFLGAALTSIVASLLVVTRKNPIHSALFLVLTLLSVTVLYLLLYSQFIAIIQVVVYAGGIVMLIVFVIMLLDLEQELRSGLKLFYSKVIGGMLMILFLFGIIYSVVAKSPTGKMGSYTPDKVSANVKAVGEVLLTQYLFPFEIVSVLLVAAVVGAVILSKKRS
ncbi:MAG TPA: NADH-quinone oxidoreductase subunit J [Thermodesulfobacteriota bacterium]|nr:NADH-quinone oxidoreductase subunit J [Thermodesulfobacteriota bacterium]